MSSNSSGLTRRVASYIQYRPRYPQAVLDVLKAECGLLDLQVIADIGCGIGILAQLFLENGNKVIGVEIDPDMRAGAENTLRNYPGFASVVGRAEATTLADQSADFVSSGQAFHWFDPVKARIEFARILRPNGWVVLIWNLQRKSDNPFQKELNAFWKDNRYWNSERALKFGSEAWKKGRAPHDVLEPFFKPGVYREKCFDNPLR